MTTKDSGAHRTSFVALAQVLEDMAAAHESGEPLDSEEPQYWAAQQGDISDQAFEIAIDFWDSWLDASRQGWHHYPKIEKHDWPRLARHIAKQLRLGTTITDATILENFKPQHTVAARGLWDWVRSIFGSRGASA